MSSTADKSDPFVLSMDEFVTKHVVHRVRVLSLSPPETDILRVVMYITIGNYDLLVFCDLSEDNNMYHFRAVPYTGGPIELSHNLVGTLRRSLRDIIVNNINKATHLVGWIYD